eukprot:16197671-Heterocapsa_arctica.AAC.1
MEATASLITSPVKHEGVRQAWIGRRTPVGCRSTRSTTSTQVAEDFCDVRMTTWRRSSGQSGPGEPGAEMTEFGEYDAGVDLTTELNASWRIRSRKTRIAGSTRVPA